LHWYLGREYTVQITVDPPTEETRKPIIAPFRQDWIQGTPTNTDPNDVGARYIIDAWDRPVRYWLSPGNDLGFRIESDGPDRVTGGGDDIGNRTPEF
jgi:hypothetical protein